MKNRFEALDVFRGLAALFVALYHFSNSGGTLNQILFIQHSNRLVNFFFVLSGFIIYFNYKKLSNPQDRNKFFLKRIFRLYPLHLFMLLLYVLFEVTKAFLFELGFFKHPAFDGNSIPRLFQSLFMLQGVAKTSGDFSWNYPSWSISAEIFTYVFFGFTILYLNKLLKNYKIIMLLLIALTFALVRINTNTYFNYIFECIYCFFFGCLIEEIHQLIINRRFSDKLSSIFEIVMFTGTIVGICYISHTYQILLIPVFGVLILIFAREQGFISSLLNNKAFVWLGSLSYSLYMVHAIILSFFEVALLTILKVSPQVFNISAIAFVCIIIVFSRFTFIYIEKRGQAFSANLWAKVTGGKPLVEKKIAIENEN